MVSENSCREGDRPEYVMAHSLAHPLMGEVAGEGIQHVAIGAYDFKALFESIEEDQIRRGVLNPTGG
jgi:4-hydroxyphenylpyruvate dioxygenase-like putative hemolysin